ncbi:EamA family transporter [Ruminococcus difficilis]|jgi:drug/metabolite transporter (DMT)-like permease|uniref:EamA family transporter n=1 Tax=Ruminococcus difficilis TaxID=2763069 RepID=A0A934TZJ0_9FIRM|nr:EamA family transporter [Ruminococcus difficilis]MBK6087618.1 EamA family transporter [Ruminococcus difficilis]
MNEKILFSLIFVFGVFISSVSQIILKKAAQKEYPNKIREYLNARVIFAYIIFFGATLCSIWAYTVIPLSLGPILESAGYIFVAVLSWLFLKEKITKKKMLGLSIIIIGIIIYSL